MVVTLDEVVGGDNHTVALNRNQATRRTNSLEQRRRHRLRGFATAVSPEARQFFQDTARNDEFWD